MNVGIPNERPSTLLAVCAQVSGVRLGSARDLLVGQPAVHMVVAGDPVQTAELARDRKQTVRTAAGYGTDRTKWTKWTERARQANGTNGFRRNGSAAAKQSGGGFSGAPPRGRPV